jgi:hypothetical protein
MTRGGTTVVDGRTFCREYGAVKRIDPLSGR